MLVPFAVGKVDAARIPTMPEVMAQKQKQREPVDDAQILAMCDQHDKEEADREYPRWWIERF